MLQLSRALEQLTMALFFFRDEQDLSRPVFSLTNTNLLLQKRYDIKCLCDPESDLDSSTCRNNTCTHGARHLSLFTMMAIDLKVMTWPSYPTISIYWVIGCLSQPSLPSLRTISGLIMEIIFMWSLHSMQLKLCIASHRWSCWRWRAKAMLSFTLVCNKIRPKEAYTSHRTGSRMVITARDSKGMFYISVFWLKKYIYLLNSVTW